jgi:hypothetical protein
MAEQESVYLWSNTALTNASSDPAINFAEGQLPGTLNNSNRAVMTAVARYVKDTDGSLTTAGSANAYTLTINGRQTPLATGHRLTFKASFSNTGAATIAVTNADAVALGTKAIRGPGDVALVSGQIVSGGVYDVRYDTAANAAAGAWLLLNPGAVATIAGNAGAFTLSGLLTNSTNDLRVTAAVQSDMETNTSTSVAVVPGVMKYSPGVAKAWVYFSPSAAIAASLGVSSITDNGVGQFAPNWTTSFSSASYFITGLLAITASSGQQTTIGTQVAGSVAYFMTDSGGTVTETGVLAGHCAAFGDI